MPIQISTLHADRLHSWAWVDLQQYLGKLTDNLPEMPWETVDRLTSRYGVTKRDVETLIGLDEYHAQGVRYYEDVVRGDQAIAKRAMNW